MLRLGDIKLLVALYIVVDFLLLLQVQETELMLAFDSRLLSLELFQDLGVSSFQTAHLRRMSYRHF